MSYESSWFQVGYQTPSSRTRHLVTPKCEKDIMHMYAETHALQHFPSARHIFIHTGAICKGTWELLFERKRALTYPFFTLFSSQFFSFLFLNPWRKYGKGLFEHAHYVLYTALHICRQVTISSYRRKWEKQQSSLYIYTTRETKSSTYIAWHRSFCPNYPIMESDTNKFWWKCPVTWTFLYFGVWYRGLRMSQKAGHGRLRSPDAQAMRTSLEIILLYLDLRSDFGWDCGFWFKPGFESCSGTNLLYDLRQVILPTLILGLFICMKMIMPTSCSGSAD